MPEQIITKESLRFKTDSFIARAIRELGAQVTLITPDPDKKSPAQTVVQK